MRQKQGVFSLFLLSPSSRRAWIEIITRLYRWKPKSSPSSRRAWIEIVFMRLFGTDGGVALLAEGVDRNDSVHCFGGRRRCVALLAEGVDRNPFCFSSFH